MINVVFFFCAQLLHNIVAWHSLVDINELRELAFEVGFCHAILLVQH
jgi:hypothetical protein